MPNIDSFSFYTTEPEEKDAIIFCDTLILLQSDLEWDQYDKDVRVVTKTEATAEIAAATMRFVTFTLRNEDDNEEITTDGLDDMFDGMSDL